MAEISENFPTLPDDLIVEILLRLQNVKSVRSVKSIGRCKCVSKTWRSLLSEPQFAKSRLDGPQNIFFFESTYKDHLIFPPYVATLTTTSCGNDGVARSVKFASDGEFSRALGSCHGLVLIFFNQFLLLLNPITEEAVKIPDCKEGIRVNYGLGYDSCTDDFKVVLIQKDEVNIYSVKTRTWRASPNTSPFSYFYRNCTARGFVDGRLNFLSSTEDVEQTFEAAANATFVIAAFNVATEEFETVPYPKGFVGLRIWCDAFDVVGGCLTLMVAASDGFYDFWLMKEYGVQDSWTKFTMASSMRPLYISGEDEIVLHENGIVVLHEVETCSRFVRYNWRSGVRRELVVDGAPKHIDKGTEFSFRESLISPDYK